MWEKLAHPAHVKLLGKPLLIRLKDWWLVMS